MNYLKAKYILMRSEQRKERLQAWRAFSKYARDNLDANSPYYNFKYAIREGLSTNYERKNAEFFNSWHNDRQGKHLIYFNGKKVFFGYGIDSLKVIGEAVGHNVLMVQPELGKPEYGGMCMSNGQIIILKKNSKPTEEDKKLIKVEKRLIEEHGAEFKTCLIEHELAHRRMFTDPKFDLASDASSMRFMNVGGVLLHSALIEAYAITSEAIAYPMECAYHAITNFDGKKTFMPHLEATKKILASIGAADFIPTVEKFSWFGEEDIYRKTMVLRDIFLANMNKLKEIKKGFGFKPFADEFRYYSAAQALDMRKQDIETARLSTSMVSYELENKGIRVEGLAQRVVDEASNAARSAGNMAEFIRRAIEES